MALPDRLHLAADRDVRRGFVVGDDDVVLVAAAQPPLAADQRRLGDVLLRERRQVLVAPCATGNKSALPTEATFGL